MWKGKFLLCSGTAGSWPVGKEGRGLQGPGPRRWEVHLLLYGHKIHGIYSAWAGGTTGSYNERKRRKARTKTSNF